MPFVLINAPKTPKQIKPLFYWKMVRKLPHNFKVFLLLLVNYKLILGDDIIKHFEPMMKEKLQPILVVENPLDSPCKILVEQQSPILYRSNLRIMTDSKN